MAARQSSSGLPPLTTRVDGTSDVGGNGAKSRVRVGMEAENKHRSQPGSSEIDSNNPSSRSLRSTARHPSPSSPINASSCNASYDDRVLPQNKAQFRASRESSMTGRTPVPRFSEARLPANGLHNQVTKKSWFRTLPNFIAQRLARHDFVAVSNVLQLIPLKFRSPDDERSFIAHILPAYGVRIRLSACIGGIVLVSFWIVCGVSIGVGVYPIGNSLMGVVSFHAIFFFVTFMLLVYYLATWSRLLQAHLETVLHVVVTVVVLLPMVWNLMITILLYKDSTGDSLKMSTQTSIDVDQLKLWTIPFVVGIPLWNLVLLNLFMQTRTRISFLPQVGILVCFLILNVAQASIASKVKTDDVSNAGESSGSFLIIAAGLECWSLLCVFSMCYFGRWNLELQERIEFWKFTKSNDHLRELRETQATRKRKSGSTAVEDLMHILVRAMTNVQDAEVTTGNKLLVESTELLRQYV